jgi:GSH-dependent disulfide-bond oxidoreductase
MIDSTSGRDVHLYESASIVLHLAMQNRRFIPSWNHPMHVECMNWLFWQMSSLGPTAGQLWHFIQYAPAQLLQTKDYGVSHFGLALQRQLSVLDAHLSTRSFILGDEYSIADILVLPWFHFLNRNSSHVASGVSLFEFLSLDQYKHCQRWEKVLLQREAVHRGMQVCSFSGVAKPWLKRGPTPTTTTN